MTDYASLLPYASPEQAEKIQAIIKHGSIKAATQALGLNPRTMSRAVMAIKARAARQGHSPDHDMRHTVPDGFNVKGVSTMYGPDGEIKGQWVKSAADAERREAIMREAIIAMSEAIPKERAAPKPKHKPMEDLLNFHVLTDFHLGALSWGEETGEDWDLTIAEDLLVGWFQLSIEQAPSAAVGVLAQLGDCLHFDSLEAVTPASGHILDADTRYAKVVRVAIRALRRVVQIMLTKYPQVRIIMADANHDPAGAIWLREFFCALYENEPRVSVDTSPDTYNCIEWGQTSIFTHHGHKRNPGNIDHVFAAKFREVFGRTKYSYAHMGHMHNHKSDETNLMIVTQHRTMAAKDAYASRGGWLSGRSADVITYHKKYGQVGTFTITPEMVE